MHHPKAILTLLFLLINSELSNCLEREFTINVEARREDCFYQTCKAGDVIDIEYQVIDGGHGDLDITFNLVDPRGRILASDHKKSENNHRVEANVHGDYRFCFDNTFSSFNTKTIFFELIVEGPDQQDADLWTSDEEQNIDLKNLRPDEVYEMGIQDVLEVMTNVKSQLNKVRHIQDLLKSVEARDRNMAEENFFKVNTFSMFQICVMLLVGFVQVVMVKSLFDDTSKAAKIWKNLKR